MKFVNNYPAREFDKISEALEFRVAAAAHDCSDQIQALNAKVDALTIFVGLLLDRLPAAEQADIAISHMYMGVEK